MGFRTILDLDVDKTLKFTAKGQVFEGYYIGFKEVQSRFGVTKLHAFKTDEGAEGLWGTAKLDFKLSQVTPGEAVRITYGGKVSLNNGQTQHKFDVQANNDDTIDVSATVINTSQSEEPTENEAGAGAALEAEPDGIDEQLAAEEDDATEGKDEDEELPPVKAKSAPPKAPIKVPTKQAADKVGSMLSKRPGAR